VAGVEREVLLGVLDDLCAELGCPEGGQGVSGAALPLCGAKLRGMLRVLSAEDELFVSAMRRALAKLASALGAATAQGVRRNALGAALDGTELVIRGELLSGNAEQIPSLIPSFVFLVTVPIVEQDAALDLSSRTSELIAGALASARERGVDRPS
jgi:hypothetical protein